MEKKTYENLDFDYSDFFSGQVDLLGLGSFGAKRPSPAFEEVRVATPQFWNQLKSGAIKKIVADIIE